MSSELLDHRGRPRVAVTGMGVKTPAGADLDTFWSTVRAATPTAATVQEWVDVGLPVTFACTVP
ncbi:MAG TPA: beta-ketoacyl synthase N-terminal-like domain-containing protein, partial [Acidimicrobiia bacterium]|nr:beta-ketoacyl synthase N-terminal-like domain-containing protein [Acidimicrobiia bacterium]